MVIIMVRVSSPSIDLGNPHKAMLTKVQDVRCINIALLVFVRRQRI
jgi:hypothetical protein